MNAMIYFIRPKGQDGPIKIGFSIYPKSRLLTYMAWSPIPLEIIAELDVPLPDRARGRKNALHLEKRFHLRHGKARLHHEWFAATPALLADIETIQDGTFDMAVLPVWVPVMELLARAKAARSESAAA